MKKTKERLYNVDVERTLTTQYNFDLTIIEVRKLQNSPASVTIECLVATIKRCLKNALFGCFVDIGLCSDANGNCVEFFGDNNYNRKLYRGDSGCFKALERKQIVVEVDHLSNCVVFVPLLGPTLVYGVLEIHGLLSTEVSNSTQLRRSSDSIRNMLTVQDYSFISKTRFWKRGNLKVYGGIPQSSDPNIAVSGRIHKVVYTKNGVPFYGGPRFNIIWEDGNEDIELTANEIATLFQETSHSLGNCTTLDAELQHELEIIGNVIGYFLEQRKSDMFLKQLSQKIQQLQLNIVGIVEMALQSFHKILVGVRDVSLAGYKFQSAEVKILINYSYAKESGTQKFSYSMQQFVQDIIGKKVNNPGGRIDHQGTTWIGIEMIVPENFLWNKTGSYDRYFVILHKKKILEHALSPFDEGILKGVVNEIKTKIDWIWKLDQRRKQFRDLLKQLELKMFEWRSLSIAEICQQSLELITTDLLNANIYLGLVMPGGEQIKYVAASKNSNMSGNKLNYGEGVSFDVIETLQTMYFDAEDVDKIKLLIPDAVVNVYYGKKLYGGKIVRYCGHELFDIRYDIDRKIETGVPMNRIIPINKAFQMKFFGKASLPFLTVSIRHRDKSIGVIGIDSIQMNGLTEKIVDEDLKIFLEQFGKLLGNAIDVKQKKEALQSMYVVAKNQHAESLDLFKALLHAISTSCASVCGIVCCRLDNVHGLITVEKYGEISAELGKKFKYFNLKKFGKKSVQKIGEKSILFLCQAIKEEILEEKVLYVIGISCRYGLYEPDVEYFEMLQKTTTSLLHMMLSQKATNEFRHEALKSIKQLCSEHDKFDRFAFFNRVMERVLTCFHSTNMYVGLLGHNQSEIRYILASAQSDMLNKILTKTNEKRVSFMAIEEDKSICVISTSPLVNNLYHFGPKHQLEFPFVVTPIIAGIDSVIGILGADNCAGNQLVESASQIDDIVSFYSTIGLSLGKVIRKYRAEDAIFSLEQIGQECQTFQDGIVKIKNLLLDFFPFVNNVYDITFLPKYQPSLGFVENLQQVDYIVFLCVTRLDLCSQNVEKLKFKILFKETCLWEYSLDEERSSKTIPINPVRFFMEAGNAFEDLQVHFIITSTLQFVEKDVARSHVPLHYFLNATLLHHEHSFVPLFSNSYSSKQVHEKTNKIGKFHLVSKLFSCDDIFGFELHSLTISIGGNMNSYNQVNLFAVIFWNGEVVGKTMALPFREQISIIWNELNHFLSASNGIENKLKIEVWMSTEKKDICIGKIKIVGEDLTKWFLISQFKELDMLVDAPTSVKIKVLGQVIHANQATSSMIMQSLRLEDTNFPLSSGLVAIQKQKSVRQLNDFIQSELKITGSRDFIFLAGIRSFITISLDEEEIGCTSISHDRTPNWNDENFKIFIPVDDPRLKGVDVCLQLFGFFESQSKPTKIGSIHLNKTQILKLSTNGFMKIQWFDLELHEGYQRFIQVDSFERDQQEHLDKSVHKHQQGQLKILSPQIKLAGWSHSDKNITEISFVEDKGYLQLDRLIIKLPNISLPPQFKCTLQIKFNGKILCSLVVTKSLIGFNILQNAVLFRYPTSGNNDLSIVLYKEQSTDELFSLRVYGDSLTELFDQSGLITKWFAIKLDDSLFKSSFFGDKMCKIGLRCGPENTQELFRFDDFKFCLDILAFNYLSILHPTFSDDRDNRHSLACLVYWNDNFLGETACIPRANHILFSQERFVLKVPIIEEEEDRLSFCKLTIVIKDQISEDVLGCLELQGKALSDFIQNHLTHAIWLDVSQDSSCVGRIKLFITNFPPHMAVVTKTIEEDEQIDQDLLIQVTDVKNLSDMDAFGGANAYVEVWHNGIEIGATQIIKNTLNLRFKDEAFIISHHRQAHASILSFKVWSLSHSKPRVFLGEVNLKATRLDYICNQDEEFRFDMDLQINDEFTQDENSFVKGSVCITFRKILALDYLRDPQWTSQSKLMLHSCTFNLIATNSECLTYLKLYRKYQREGNQYEEIFKSNMTSSCNPQYESQCFAIDIPTKDDDWNGFELMFTINDVSDFPFLKAVLFGKSASEILCRKNKDTVSLMEFTLLPMDNYPLVDRSFPSVLKIAGGIKTDFDEEFPSCPFASKISRVSQKHMEIEKYMHIVRLECDPLCDMAGTIAFLWDNVSIGTVTVKLSQGRGNIVGNLSLPIISSSIHSKDADLQAVLNMEDNLVGTPCEAIKSKAIPIITLDYSMNIILHFEECPVKSISIKLSHSANNNSSIESLFHFPEVEKSATIPTVVSCTMSLISLDEFTIANKTLKNSEIYLSCRMVQENEVLFKTQAYKASSNIIFDCEVFNFELYHHHKMNSRQLIISLMAKNQFRGDSKICELVIDDSSGSLNDLFSCIGKKESYLLHYTKEYLQHSNGNSAPLLILSFKMKPNFANSILFNPTKPLPKTLLEIELTIVAAAGLKKVRYVGSTNPYAVVTYNFQDVGKTTIIIDSLNPVWRDNQSFKIRIPLKFYEGIFEHDKDTTEQLHNNDFSQDGVQTLNDLQLCIDFFDDRLLGSVEICGSDLIALSKDQFVRKWFEFVKSSRFKKSDENFVQGKTCLVFSRVNSYVQQKELQISLISVSNLEVNGGEVYIKIRWNGRYVGQTQYSKLNGISLENNSFFVKVPKNCEVSTCVLNFEVWHMKANDKEDFLGGCEIYDQQLQNIIENRTVTNCTLSKADYLSEEIQHRQFCGSIEFQSYFSDNLHVISSNQENEINKSNMDFELSILSIKKLNNNSNSDSINPYVICKWNEKELLRTSSVAKSCDPIWKGERCVITVNNSENLGDNVCTLEVWNYRNTRKDMLLGRVDLTGENLEEILNPISETNKFRFALMPPNDSSAATGSIEINIEYLRDTENNSEEAWLQDIEMNWPELIASNMPLFQFSLLETKIIFSNSDTKAFANSKPIVKNNFFSLSIRWLNNEVGYLSPVELINNLLAWNENSFLLPFNSTLSKSESDLKVEIWEGKPSEQMLVGSISLSAEQVFQLYHGTFLLPLNCSTTNNSTVWYGHMKFKLECYYEIWDFVKPIPISTYHRTITVIGASNLPSVNGEFPDTKCVIFVNGIVFASSPVVANTANPYYPQFSIDLVVDFNDTFQIAIEIVYINSAKRKEVTLGREEVLVEFLLRPPNDAFDLFLGPAGKKHQEYQFALSGSVRLKISGSNRLDDPHFHPYSQQFFSNSDKTSSSLSQIVVKDNIRKEIKEFSSGKNLSISKKASVEYLSDHVKSLLGTLTNLSLPQEVPLAPMWLAIPVSDVGVMLGNSKRHVFGTAPGNRFVFAMERPLNRMAVSDASVVQDITFSISSCIVKLRWKDIYRKMRESVSTLLERMFDKLLSGTKGIEISEIWKKLSLCIQKCLPNTTFRIITAAPDYTSLTYQSLSLEKDDSSILVIPSEYGCDILNFGRCYRRSSVIYTTLDLQKRSPIIFNQLKNQHFPRITSIIGTEDVSIGLLQLENFMIYQRGLNTTMSRSELLELQLWMEHIGSLCGGVICRHHEESALKEIIMYTQYWDFSLQNLQKVVLMEAMKVIQGCKLAEIICVDNEFKLASVLTRKPKHAKLDGRKLIIRNVRMIEVKGASNANSSQPESFGSKLKSFFGVGNSSTFNKSSQIKGRMDEESTVDESTIHTIHSHSEQFIVGIRYDNLEQLLSTNRDAATNSIFVDKDIVAYIKPSQITTFVLYEVNNNLSPVAEYSGVLNFTLNGVDVESKILLKEIGNCEHDAPKRTYELVYTWEWDSNVQNEAYDKSFVQGFKVQVLSGHLTKIKKSPPNPFCEIFFGKKHIANTKSAKSTGSPEWKEYFYIPYKEKSSTPPLIIDVYDMSFMRKGNFLGRVEISFEQLLLLNGNPIDYSLQERSDILAKKQSFVGGNITISCTVELINSSATINNTKDNKDVGMKIAENHYLSIIRSMANPQLKLTIESAKGLASANRFGGGSDPFALILGGSENGGKVKTLGKTKVISETINPIWEESFTIPILPLLKRNNVASESFIVHGNEYLSDSIEPYFKHSEVIPEDLPIFRIEIYDYNKITSSVFLGQCELSPIVYLSKTNDSMVLQGTKSPEENLFVKGNIQLKWEFIDQFPTTKELKEDPNIPYSDPLHTTNHTFSNIKHYLWKSLPMKMFLEISILEGLDMNKLINIHKKQSNNANQSINLYILLKFNGETIGRTETFINNVNQISIREKFIFPILLNASGRDIMLFNKYCNSFINIQTVHAWKEQSLHFELWCEDYFNDDENLGSAALNIFDVLVPSPRDVIDINFQSVELTVPTISPITSSAKKIGGFMSRIMANSMANAEQQQLTTNDSNAHLTAISVECKMIKQHPKISSTIRSNYKLYQKYSNTLEEEIESNENIPLLMIYDPNLETNRQKQEKTSLPELIQKTQSQLERYENNPFDRIGFISELHYGQLCAASRRGERTILKTKKADSICLPLYKKQSLSTLVTLLPTAATKSLASAYMIFRYVSGKLSRRDQMFLERLQDTITSNIETHYINRLQRYRALEALVENMLVLSKLSTNNTPEEIIIQSVLDIELSLNCPTKFYLLIENGLDFIPVSVENEKLLLQTHVNAHHQQHDFIQQIAKYCRYGLMIQYYHNKYSIIQTNIKNIIPEQLTSWESLQSEIDRLEEEGFCQQLFQSIENYYPDGMYAIPIFAHQQIMIGLLIIKNIDTIPPVLYEFEVIHKETITTNDQPKTTNKIYTIEHKISEMILQASQYFGDSVFLSRIDHVYKSLRTFPMKVTTDPIMYIRYAFRKLIQAIPIIRKISLWAIYSMEHEIVNSNVDMMAEEEGGVVHHHATSKRVAEMIMEANRLKDQPPIPSNNFPSLASIFLGFKKPTTPATGTVAAGAAATKQNTVKSKSPHEKIMSQQHLTKSSNRNTFKPFPITAGYFGDEDPINLLATPLERTGASNNNNNQYNRNRRQGKTTADLSIELQLLEKAKWTIGYPFALSPQLHSNANTDLRSVLDRRSAEFIKMETLQFININKMHTFSNCIGITLSQIGLCEESLNVIASQVFHHHQKKNYTNEKDVSQSKHNINGQSSFSSNSKRPPLPAGPPPSVRVVGKVIPSDKALTINSSRSSASVTMQQPDPLNENKSTINNYHYFLAVNSHGIGGNSGWGTIGEPTEKALNTICAILDGSLNKLYTLQQKAGRKEEIVAEEEEDIDEEASFIFSEQSSQEILSPL